MSLILLNAAFAAEVVWLSDADEATRELVADTAGATGPALKPMDLRSAAFRVTEADDTAYANLVKALGTVREFEQKLDGELVIMQDLATPLAAISVMRDEADRTKVFQALAYQGFAVNRFFDVDLATDDKAKNYRVELDGVVVEKPWMDAVAIEPERKVTQYEIAEAPQRIAYGKVQEVVSGALPASIVPEGLPEGGELWVDGRKTEVGASGNIRVTPGRHFVHVQADGAVLERWDITLAPAQNAKATVALTDEVWNGFLQGLAPGGSVPELVGKSVTALGGEVWLARDDGAKTPTVFKVTSSSIESVEIKPVKNTGGGGGSDEDGVSIVLIGAGGWMSSGNWYTDNPVAGRSSSTVNSAAASAGVAVEADVGILRLGAGTIADMTFGSDHVARYDGNKTTRIFPFPHLSFGIRYVDLAIGYALPQHPAGALRVNVPLAEDLELRGSARLGVGGNVERNNGTKWERLPLYSANLGIAYRLGL